MSVLLDKSLALSILINVDEQSFTLFLLFDFSSLSHPGIDVKENTRFSETKGAICQLQIRNKPRILANHLKIKKESIKTGNMMKNI